METVSKIEVLKISLQHYKYQNEYLNDFNDKLMQENIRLREYLEETNANYQELIISAKEVMRRNKLTQQQNEELTKQSKELQYKVQVREEEHARLQRRSQGLDGLTMLVEETLHI